MWIGTRPRRSGSANVVWPFPPVGRPQEGEERRVLGDGHQLPVAGGPALWREVACEQHDLADEGLGCVAARVDSLQGDDVVDRREGLHVVLVERAELARGARDPVVAAPDHDVTRVPRHGHARAGVSLGSRYPRRARGARLARRSRHARIPLGARRSRGPRFALGTLGSHRAGGSGTADRQVELVEPALAVPGHERQAVVSGRDPVGQRGSDDGVRVQGHDERLGSSQSDLQEPAARAEVLAEDRESPGLRVRDRSRDPGLVPRHRGRPVGRPRRGRRQRSQAGGKASRDDGPCP